jgi:hypothetical protein
MREDQGCTWLPGQMTKIAPAWFAVAAAQPAVLISNARLRFSSYILFLDSNLFFKFTIAIHSANITLNPLSGLAVILPAINHFAHSGC